VCPRPYLCCRIVRDDDSATVTPRECSIWYPSLALEHAECLIQDCLECHDQLSACLVSAPGSNLETRRLAWLTIYHIRWTKENANCRELSRGGRCTVCYRTSVAFYQSFHVQWGRLRDGLAVDSLQEMRYNRTCTPRPAEVPSARTPV
jgi:hypothetical protein